jgi:hypothetical protein
MQFNKLINRLLKESAYEEYGILYKDDLYMKGDDIPGDVIYGNHFIAGLNPEHYRVIKLWKFSSIRKCPRQPDILPMPPGNKPNKTIGKQNYGNKQPISVISKDTINGTIDIDNIVTVTSYNVDFRFTISGAGSGTSYVVYQSKNKDGTHTAWYNSEGLSGPSTVLDFQIIDKNEHEKNLTVQAHKDSDLSDMVDF